jgi:V8-like Glu-specific endopeptidase
VSGALSCSGALIFPRIVRTAAHCMIQSTVGGGAPVAVGTFVARKDGSATPHATGSTGFYFYGGAYIPNGCGTMVGSNYWAGYQAGGYPCNLADWAFLILGNNWYGDQAGEAGWTSWYGYQLIGSSGANMELRSGGYPSCDDTWNAATQTWNENAQVEDPANCGSFPSSFYQDSSSPCKVGSWLSGNTLWRTGCDTSPGDSGEAFIKEGTGLIIGHYLSQDCTTCPVGTPNRTEPNRGLGHDSWLFNFEESLRVSYP